MGWFHVDPVTPSISVPPFPDTVLLEERLWGIPAALCVLARGDLPLHAAAVEINGVAVLLAAPGRSGKTTLVSALLREGFSVLSEDLACCRVTPTGPVVVPGPAMLRVRRDSYGRLNLRHTTLVAEDSERYHLVIEPPLRGSGSPVPVRSLVFLRWGAPHEAPRLDRTSPVDAVRYLWSLAFHLPIDSVRAQCFENVSALAGEVQLWDLTRPKNFDYLRETVDKVVATCAP